MQHNTNDYIEKVKELAGKYDSEVSVEEVGHSVDTIWKLRIGMEIKITSGRFIIIDKEGKVEEFKKSQSGEQKSLAHIETLLK